ncbi:hypothetical protein DPMN_020865 [Dreissena polymorpha]|uniref:Uncharacterized protein n=1 Tax=Dreissena polymorpha TaxID=45954 RepID=A0A9D4SBE1_DREPO|nr:hypothetical protein DPMN_020865 [Dreissena polymorpha]
MRYHDQGVGPGRGQQASGGGDYCVHYLRPSKAPRDHRQGGRRASGGLPQAPHPFNINASATSTTATDRKRDNRSVRASYRPLGATNITLKITCDQSSHRLHVSVVPINEFPPYFFACPYNITITEPV